MTLKDALLASQLGGGSGGGGMSALMVNIVIDWDSDTPTATVDKTFAEITSAFNNGADVFGKDEDGYIYQLVFIDSEMVGFELNTISSNNLLHQYVIVLDDGTCEFEIVRYVMTPEE